jgi:hypothetical protein
LIVLIMRGINPLTQNSNLLTQRTQSFAEKANLEVETLHATSLRRPD